MMTGNLRVTPEKLISTSQQFADSDNKVNNLTNQMMNIASQLTSTWAGEAATGYYNKLRGLQNDMQKLHRMIQEHNVDLMEMARTYQQAERQNIQTGNALRTNEIV
jgi:WXG100 family type VII secretion target